MYYSKSKNYKKEKEMGAHPATGSHVSITHIYSTSHGNAGKLNMRNESLVTGLKMHQRILKII